MAQTSSQALVAHALRRLTFGPAPEQVERFAAGNADPTKAANAAIEWAFAAPAQPIIALGEDQWDSALRGWISSMQSPEAGVHEKLTWFWHGHFATSSDKVGNMKILHAQQALLRKHALGNFGTLLREITTDPGMLLYLDGAGSSVEAPNENYAREVMELFTIGRGSYTEADVKAGALALAGWNVDYESGKVSFDESIALGGEVVYLGRRGRLGVDDVVSALLAHPNCAPFVASKLWTYFIGVPPSKDRAAEFGKVFRDGNYEIAPLVQMILRSPDFLNTRLSRPRFPVEWFLAANAAFGPPRDDVDDKDTNPWVLEQLDQLPYRPPNVAGWPISAKWLSASQQLARASYAWSYSWRMRPFEDRDLVSAALWRCSIHECSDETRRALEGAAMATAGSADALSVSRRLIAAALCSPEFALA